MQPKSIELGEILELKDYALKIFEDLEIQALYFYEKCGNPYSKNFIDDRERPTKPDEISVNFAFIA